MDVQLRRADLSDADEACVLLRRCIVECCTADHHDDANILSQWLANKTPETVADWFANPSLNSFIATDGARLLGMGTLAPGGKIVLLYVCPTVRFSGVGKVLLQALERYASQARLPALKVVSTLTAQDFFMRHGFDNCQPTTTPFGCEAISLSKRLSGNCYPDSKPCHCG